MLGTANLLIAQYMSEQMWVYLGKIGLTIVTFVFAVIQVLYIVKVGEEKPSDAPPVQEPPAV